jgi:hypothetical protein
MRVAYYIERLRLDGTEIDFSQQNQKIALLRFIRIDMFATNTLAVFWCGLAEMLIVALIAQMKQVGMFDKQQLKTFLR